MSMIWAHRVSRNAYVIAYYFMLFEFMSTHPYIEDLNNLLDVVYAETPDSSPAGRDAH